MTAALLARRIGSRWCCAWQVAVTLAALGLILSSSLTLRLGWDAYVQALGVEALADMAAGLVLVGAAQTVLRNRRTRQQPFWLVLGVWILVAAVRLTVYASLAPEAVGSVITFNVAIPVWALVVVYIYAGFDDGRTGAREVAEANAALLDVQGNTQHLLAQQQDQLAAIVQSQIADEVTHLRESVRRLDQPGAAADVTALANQVAEYSTNVVRETSHRLRQLDTPLLGPNLRPGSAQVTWPSVFDVYRQARQPIVVPMVLIAMRGLIGSLLRWDPSTLATQALTFTVVFGIAWGGRAAIERITRRPSVVELLLSTLLVVLVVLATTWGFAVSRSMGPENPSLIPLPAIAVFAIGVLILGRLVAGVNMRWQKVTIELEAVNAELTEANDRLASELTEAREQLADILHGPVQGRLAAASMALRLYSDAQASGRPVDLPETLSTTTTLLDRALDDLTRLGRASAAPWTSLDAGLDHVRQTWAGMVSVTWTTEGRLDPQAVPPVVAVIEELVTNASRHADARHVEVTVNCSPSGTVEIVALNDGDPAVATPVAGSGLGLLTRYDGQWSIDRAGDDRTCVRVTIRPT